MDFAFALCVIDMSVERNLLMKEAVPYLRDYCKERGLDYQVSVTYPSETTVMNMD